MVIKLDYKLLGKFGTSLTNQTVEFIKRPLDYWIFSDTTPLYVLSFFCMNTALAFNTFYFNLFSHLKLLIQTDNPPVTFCN
jgi:hypothetical protein